jgi:Transcriptional regulator, AbiEi antitoxin
MPAEFASEPDIRTQTQSRHPDRLIADLAERQFGVVSRRQLSENGLRPGAIGRRVRNGRLHLLHPGVYAVGRREIPPEGRWTAAVLAGGEGAVLSHDSAAALWAIRRPNPDSPIEISVHRTARSSNALRRHCVRHLPDEVTIRRGIPTTTLERTLLDLAGVIPAGALEMAVREAEYLHGMEPEALARVLERHPGQRGTRSIRTCLRSLGLGPRGRTRSGLEVRFAALLADSNLPNPELNVILDLSGRLIEADCLWRRQMVIVELDGGRAHRTRAAFESDR